MADNILRISQTGDQPEIELAFGFAQFAQYKIFFVGREWEEPDRNRSWSERRYGAGQVYYQ